MRDLIISLIIAGVFGLTGILFKSKFAQKNSTKKENKKSSAVYTSQEEDNYRKDLKIFTAQKRSNFLFTA
jgi:Holliday junction resolvase RusA-like endonuclease